QRDAPAQPVADDAADGAANHHADHAVRQHRRERRAWQVPFLHQDRDDATEHLIVEAVEDDDQRRREDEQLLISAPFPIVENRTDVDSFHSINPLNPWNLRNPWNLTAVSVWSPWLAGRARDWWRKSRAEP